jgi:hypothetical protein
MAFKDGPYLQVACFCEQVIEDKSNVLSLIRIVDTITGSAAGPSPPEEMPPVNFTTNLVVMAKSGTARGRRTLSVELTKPSLEKHKLPIELTVHFEGEEKGSNVIARLQSTFDQEGLYWFDILLNGVKWTSLPMRVKYSRVVTTGPPTVG